MKILQNFIELSIVTLQQYSVNNDVLTFEFEKPLNFILQGSLVQIIYEVDKLDNIKNNNITIEETENTLIVTWVIKENITLTAGDKRVQIVIKNDDRVYLSDVFIVKILESLNVDNEIVETGLSYLEYWEQRMKELAEKIEYFEELDITQFVTNNKLDETLLNYFDKLEIEEKLKEKANVLDVYLKSDTYNKNEVDDLIKNVDISEQLDFATKEELNRKLDLSTYNTDKNTFQLKNDNNLNTNDKTIAGAINELKNKIGNTSHNMIAGNGINISENRISAKVDNNSITFNEKGELTAKLTVNGGNDEGNATIKQYIIKNVISNTLYTVEDNSLPINHKVLPVVLVSTTSKQNTKTITDFELEEENIIANNGIKIQDAYTLNVSNSESEIINKSNFVKILNIKGGV